MKQIVKISAIFLTLLMLMGTVSVFAPLRHLYLQY